jgi:hypothetical protein
MKIKFENNSVSGVNRRYIGFTLDIPGRSSQIVDVPRQYVKNALSYLKHRHPAVICTPIVAAEKTKEAVQSVVSETSTETDPQAETTEEGVGEPESKSETETTTETTTTDGTETTETTPQGKATVSIGNTKKKKKKSGGKK